MRQRALDGLVRGARDAKHPFHRPVFTTVNRLGHPESRTVVLREFDRDSHNLFLYTDARSGKARELKDEPEATWLFYDHGQQTQLRVTTRCKLYRSDEMKGMRWNRFADHHKGDYRGLHAPGTPIEHPRASDPPAQSAAAYGYEHFLIIGGKIRALDILILNRQGHVRARFDFSRADIPGTWLAP